MIGSDPIFSVSQFVTVFNQSMEMMYPQVGVVGELANYRISKGRWVYFDLKDEKSSIKFFGSVSSLPGPLEEGMNLEVFGRPRLHNLYGFSVNVDNIRVVGEGSIAKAKQLLARKLELEGLFAEERKRTLPYPPTKIGLITSVESAAYTDFIKVLDHRWGNMEIQLIDCLVQGADAPRQIVSAIDFFNQMASPPEVLILIRGGGSADDLAGFSTEEVVRAVASSRVPTLVAIGHERDMSLAELAADKRASTPSNAAELIAPDKRNEQEGLRVASSRLNRSLDTVFKSESDQIKTAKENIASALTRLIEREEQLRQQQMNILRALDPNAPLKRGFALIRNNQGQLVRSVKKLKTHDKLSVGLQDGNADVKVIDIRSNNGR
jgi:exodeoxyribonuclease VII large subunit